MELSWLLIYQRLKWSSLGGELPRVPGVRGFLVKYSIRVIIEDQLLASREFENILRLDIFLPSYSSSYFLSMYKIFIFHKYFPFYLRKIQFIVYLDWSPRWRWPRSQRYPSTYQVQIIHQHKKKKKKKKKSTPKRHF